MNKEEQILLINKMKDIPIMEISNFIPNTGSIPQLLYDVGIKTLYELYYINIEKMHFPKNFPVKKSLDLQRRFQTLENKTIQDVIFWNTRRTFPTHYDPDRDLVDNLHLVLGELYLYILECEKRGDQIRFLQDRKRVLNLKYAIKEHYYRNTPLKDIANELSYNKERVRQLLKDELLIPLFNQVQITNCQQVLGNICINSELIKQVKEYVDSEIFSIVKSKLSRFCRHVLNIDYVEIQGIGYITVPAGEKGVYNSLILPFLEEMTSIMKPLKVEDIIERIGQNQRVRRDILDKGKVYNNNFLYGLLYCEELTEVSDDGIVISPKYIRKGNGTVHQEKALARIIADAGEPLRRDEIIEEFISRYGGCASNVSLTTTSRYGCRPHAGGKVYWEYGGGMITARQWIEIYSREQEVFSFDDIFKAIVQDGYIVSERTLRTYVTNICAVDNDDINRFCYKESIDKFPQYRWRNPIRHGIINWLANNLRLKFESEGVDELHISQINEFLFERSRNTDYQVENIYDHAILIQNSSLTLDEDSPFVIVSKERGDWCLRKNQRTYDTIDWAVFGWKGRMHEQKLIALATKIVRQTPHFKMYLMNLVDKIVEDEEVDNLSRTQIRKKLISFINETKISHSLKLSSANDRRLLEVSIDAKKLVLTEKYKPVNNTLLVEYVSISQLKKYEWDKLRPVLYQDLSFCSKWLDEENLMTYDEAIDKFISLVKQSRNKNLNYILPQKLYEFFFVSNPTEEDRYCIMCSIAKNFEALLKEIYFLNTNVEIKTKGLLDLARICGFHSFVYVLECTTHISVLSKCYEKALKYLQSVRNTDTHGNWYIDNYRGDTRSESEKNIEKIRNFAALYIFATAKYLG